MEPIDLVPSAQPGRSYRPSVRWASGKEWPTVSTDRLREVGRPCAHAGQVTQAVHVIQPACQVMSPSLCASPFLNPCSLVLDVIPFRLVSLYVGIIFSRWKNNTILDPQFLVRRIVRKLFFVVPKSFKTGRVCS